MKFMREIFLILLLITSAHLHAQRHTCSTVSTPEDLKRLEANVANSFAVKSQVARFVPVQIHLVYDNDGSNGISIEEITSKMCILNERFESIEIHFYIAGISQIFNTNLNHRQRLNSSISLIRNSKNANALNIFLVNEILDNNFGNTGSAGFYSRGAQNDYIVMLQSTPGDDGYTMEHEIGHHFSLEHTHFGWEGDIAQGNGGYNPDVHGDTVRIEIITGSTQAPNTEVELMDGSNCTTAGDRICDTPPDYGFGQACSCCTMQWDVWDRNGEMIVPMLDNVMSYSNNCNELFFTEGQRDAMYADFDSPFRSHLRTGEVTEYTPLTSSVEVIAPQNFDVYESFDGALIEWEAVEHAETYVINISGDQSLRYETSDTELYIEDLEPSSAYTLEIRALNKFGTGCQTSTRRIFDTGSGSTSVNETESINELNIYPNPVRGQRDLVLDFNSNKKLDGKIKLHNIQGHVVELNNTTFAAGKNNIKINTRSLTSGLYILEIETAEGIISEKIVVE